MLKQNDIEIRDKFQHYAGKRIQWLLRHTPNETCCRGLGWMRKENYIYAKNLLFIRTIMNMDVHLGSIYKRVFISRAIRFHANIRVPMNDTYDSPIFDLLRTAVLFGIHDIVMNMVTKNPCIHKDTNK